MQDTEAEILLLIQNNSSKEKGFNLLIKSFQKQLYWQIRDLTKNHEDTNDVLQNVLVKIWRYIDGFKGDSKLSSWLYRIARNETITFLNKKNKRKIANLNDETKSIVFESIKAESFIETETIYSKLEKAIETLPKKQKQIFKLRYFESIKYTKMAKMMNLTEGSLKASYHHAVKKIERFLKEN